MCLPPPEKRLISFILFVSVLFITGCDLTKESVGVEGSLVIVADALDSAVVQPHFRQTFGALVETPQPETRFAMSWIDADELGENVLSPIILMTAAMNGDGATAKYVKSMLSEDVLMGVDAGEYIIFKRENPWAKPQLLLILVGRNSAELAENAHTWSDTLLKWSEDFERQRITEQLFDKGEQVDIERQVREKHGFTIRVQRDYAISQDNESQNFVRFIRHFPDRWVCVAWGNLDSDSTLSADFIIDRREEIGLSYLDPVNIYKDRCQRNDVLLGGREAILVRGLWATVGPTGGGPFFTYGLQDREHGKYYLVDCAVFAPGEVKLPLLWQLEAIANSFNPSPSK